MAAEMMLGQENRVESQFLGGHALFDYVTQSHLLQRTFRPLRGLEDSEARPPILRTGFDEFHRVRIACLHGENLDHQHCV